MCDLSAGAKVKVVIMATNITNSVAFGNTGHFSVQPKRVDNFAARLVEKFQSWRMREAAINELSQFSDLELADIGVGRQQISTFVRCGRR
ncbi:MAG: hypothetical protein B7Z75_04835 [Acidocella sp. 20-57-95]|nr:MAG: hypothetical protein B7Z75_04835 [Acidocella sp. 20-57-95]OYV59978.1 MAG: hypothetical protein B7Z71_07045 [Acidocella sp. 21-58-7]